MKMWPVNLMEANSQTPLWKTKVNWPEVGLHALMWVGYVLFFTLAFGVDNNKYDEFLMAGLVDLPSQLLFAYVTLYWLIPHFFLRKRYISYVAFTLVLLSVTALLMRVLVYYYLLPHFQPQLLAGQTLIETARLSRATFYVVAPSSIMIAIHLMRFNYRQAQLNQQLANAKLSAELKLLKDQINPHFLFNTLNNLYGLTQKNHTKASEAVMRLSQLMHYMLYEGNRDRVPLLKEVECLRNYLELERIRYDNRLQLSFTVSGDTRRFSIAPLLLLPFVENAFKHGMRKQLGEAWLQISLQAEGSEMIFKVANSKPCPPNGSGLKEEALPHEGIGLSNVSKRLAGIYPNRHRLRMLDEGDAFLVTLVISLEETTLSPSKQYEDQLSTH